jgi:hypothetical protein
VRKPKEQMPSPRPQDEYETHADRLQAYIQFVADTKCTTLELGDYYYEYSGDITLVIESEKAVAHDTKTGTVVVAKPQPPTDEEWMNAIR